ncbi:MAG: tRNA (adenosine(37)-N6)-dimethylallyltransferase MiaA [Gammaproteobacteria bacterium]|nr:tRNA (adenosine(37)-N6)-dimethylallyltransferase MiaA [Gammaproteobacteria bacterium]
MQKINPKNCIFCLMGPTASGKSHLAFQIASQLPCEIMSVDSGCVYRDMDIGTAKPPEAERTKIPYHLIDIRNPKEPYSAADFCKDALKKISAIHKRNRIPLLVGGTMLYFRSLLFGLSQLPAANQTIRKKILKEAKQFGWEKLHDRLKSVDPKSATKIHPHDPQRLQRALEVFELTGKPLSELYEKNKQNKFPYQHLDIAIAPTDRKILHENIEKRFEKMLAQGFIEEVKKLYERGDLNPNLPSMRSVGYRQVWAYLDGKLSFDEMKTKAIAATRQLAKRQLTWLRNWPEKLNWFDSGNNDLIQDILALWRYGSRPQKL